MSVQRPLLPSRLTATVRRRHGPHSRRHLPHGLGPALSRRSAEPHRHGRRLLDRSDARSPMPQFRAFVAGDGLRDLGRDRRPIPRTIPAPRPKMLKAGGLRVHATQQARRPRRLQPVVALHLRRDAGGGPTARAATIGGLDDHPVVQVGLQGRRGLRQSGPARSCRPKPKWEFAARGGLDGAEFAWGDEFTPGGQHMANTWQGSFPHENLRALTAGRRTSPVRAFPRERLRRPRHDRQRLGNGRTDWYSSKHPGRCRQGLLRPRRTRAAVRPKASYDPRQPQIQIPRKVLEGRLASCAPSYCRRYRPAARHAEAVDTTTSHVGFRCIVRHAAGG